MKQYIIKLAAVAMLGLGAMAAQAEAAVVNVKLGKVNIVVKDNDCHHHDNHAKHDRKHDRHAKHRDHRHDRHVVDDRRHNHGKKDAHHGKAKRK